MAAKYFMNMNKGNRKYIKHNSQIPHCVLQKVILVRAVYSCKTFPWKERINTANTFTTSAYDLEMESRDLRVVLEQSFTQADGM